MTWKAWTVRPDAPIKYIGDLVQLSALSRALSLSTHRGNRSGVTVLGISEFLP